MPRQPRKPNAASDPKPEQPIAASDPKPKQPRKPNASSDPEPEQPRKPIAASDPKPKQPRKPNASSDPKPYKRGRMPKLSSQPSKTSDPEPEQPQKPNTASDPKPENVKSGRGSWCNEEEKAKGEWDEIRCFACLDHPHDSIVLICSSHHKGCRPHVCDPGYHRPNCFDLFCEIKSLVRPSKLLSDGSRRTGCLFAEERVPHKVLCPHCSGEVLGWIISEQARGYMNQIVRTCALDSCDFRGDYVDLRFHAIDVHGFKDEDEY